MVRACPMNTPSRLKRRRLVGRDESTLLHLQRNETRCLRRAIGVARDRRCRRFGRFAPEPGSQSYPAAFSRAHFARSFLIALTQLLRRRRRCWPPTQFPRGAHAPDGRLFVVGIRERRDERIMHRYLSARSSYAL